MLNQWQFECTKSQKSKICLVPKNRQHTGDFFAFLFLLVHFPFLFKCYLIKLKPCLETDTKIPWYYSASGQCREHFFQPKIILILENQTGTDLGNDLRYLCTMTSFLSQVFLLYVWYYFKVVGEDRAGGTENNILEHWFHMVPQVWPHLWTLSFPYVRTVG